MIDLEKIKARLKTLYCRDGYSFVTVDEGAQWLKDIRALVAEVERLNAENDLMGKMLIARGCDEPIAEVVRLGDRIEELEAEVERLRAATELQPCGHPKSAIVTARDLGGPGTQSCGMCLAEKIDRTV